VAKKTLCWKSALALVVLLIGGTLAGVGYKIMGSPTPPVEAEESVLPVTQVEENAEAPIAVTTVRPRKGAMARLTTQPGSVHAFESVQLFAKVSGFLKSQAVNIGDRIKAGQVLAVVDVPELEKQAQRDRAAVDQADAKVDQMKARVDSAKADLEAAKATLKQAEAGAKSAAAWVRWRTIQHQRMKDLFATHSIEEKLVDESKERKEAAIESEQAAQAAIGTAVAQISAKGAKIVQANADVTAAQAEVKVAQAELERVQVQLGFAKIIAPFDGVVTHRSMFPGDFVRAATESGNQSLLTVQRTDMMTVVVQVPDRDVIYADVGDPVTLEIDALPGVHYTAKISRIAQSQDPQTRLMRVEIDLPNPLGKIRDGMYGRATILLDKGADTFSMPTSCLVNKSEDGSTGSVYVVKDGHAHLVPVRLGDDNGLRVAVLGGLTSSDHVILSPSTALADGAAVTATYLDEGAPKAGSEK
jgi:HlyD family secretion protein